MLTGHLQHTAAASSLQGTGKGGSLGGRVTPFCLQLAAAWLASPLQLQQPEDSEKTGRRKQINAIGGGSFSMGYITFLVAPGRKGWK